MAFGSNCALVGRIGVARAAYVGVMSTILALVVSALVGGYEWSLATFVGIALAVAGNALARYGQVNSRPVESAA